MAGLRNDAIGRSPYPVRTDGIGVDVDRAFLALKLLAVAFPGAFAPVMSWRHIRLN